MGIPTTVSLPLIEETLVPDVFISGIGRIERLAGNLARITYYAERRTAEGDVEHVVALRMIQSVETWPQAIRMVALALGNADQPFIAEDVLLTPAH